MANRDHQIISHSRPTVNAQDFEAVQVLCDSGDSWIMDAAAVRTARMRKILADCIHDFGLDLTNLTVFTEAASGPYVYPPVLAALSGARRVYALARDSAYATKGAVAECTRAEADRFDVAKRLDIVYDKSAETIGASDIITNSGFVRPIDSPTVSWMKPTAVVPLMWETWEFRDADVDLDACRSNDILVLCTREDIPPQSMFVYCGFIAMKLLFELGLEGHHTRVLLLGGHSIGRSIFDHLSAVGVETEWFANETDSRPYSELHDFFTGNGSRYDAIIVAEHHHHIMLIGAGGLLTCDEITETNPALAVGVIAGNVDGDALTQSSIRHAPDVIRPFGYMSYQAYHLGPRPVVELYAAGLKVGQTMAHARLAGASIDVAAKDAIEHAAGMDYEGEKAWLPMKN